MNHCRSTHVFATMLAITLAGSLAGAAPQDAKDQPRLRLGRCLGNSGASL